VAIWGGLLLPMPDLVSVKAISYLAEYEFGVDEKRRVQVPSKWRPGEVGEGFEYVLLRWQTEPGKPVCLLVLPPDCMERLRQKMGELSFSDPRAETLRRSLTRSSDTATLDSAGRIVLPQRLAEAAGIKKRAILVGMFDRFQIWSPENYELVRAEDEANTSEAMRLI
jgi:MraZ protein